MPKSKRDKKISLTRTDKKPGLETKAALVDKVRTAVDTYARIFVFQVENMRNNKLKSVRESWSHSKFFIGKNRVLSKALGNTAEEEYAEGLSMVAKCLRNECGLLATNQSQEEVLDYFTRLAEPDFARTGGVATETVVLEQGPLPDFGHSMEPQLRQLGLPASLVRGVVTLVKEHIVCMEGDVLTSEQARILKLLGHQHAEFRLKLVSSWNKEGGKFTLLANPSKGDSAGEDEEGSDIE
jgi:mRNA turnover protein 4